MSPRAKATTCAATSCCASPSPSVPWPARWRPRSLAILANRPALQQPGQQAEPGEQRVPPLPRRQFDVGPGVAVDLPRNVIGAAGEGQAGLGEAQHRQTLPFDPAPRPAWTPAAFMLAHLGKRGLGEAAVALGLDVDHRRNLDPPLGAKLGRIGEREGSPPPVKRILPTSL